MLNSKGFCQSCRTLQGLSPKIWKYERVWQRKKWFRMYLLQSLFAIRFGKKSLFQIRLTVDLTELFHHMFDPFLRFAILSYAITGRFSRRPSILLNFNLDFLLTQLMRGSDNQYFKFKNNFKFTLFAFSNPLVKNQMKLFHFFISLHNFPSAI